MSETEEVKLEMAQESETFDRSVPQENVETSVNGGNLDTNNPAVLSSRVATEHNYAKLMPFRSSHCSGKEASFPTVVLFPDRVRGKKKKKKKHIKGGLKGKPVIDDASSLSMTAEMSGENLASSVLSDSGSTAIQTSSTLVEGECNR